MDIIEFIEDMGTIWIVSIVIYMIASGIFCAILADAKNRNADGWFFAGFFFGLLAVIAIAGMPAQPESSASKSMILSKETLIVVGAVAVLASGFFLLKKQEPLPTASSPATSQSNNEGMSMAMIDALPQDYATLVQMGNQYMDQRNFAVASEIYSRALAIDGSSSDVRTDYGACLHGMGMPERAIAEFKKVVTTDPAHAIAHFNIGIVYNQLGQTDSALVYFQHYLDREPNGKASEAAKQFLKDLDK